MARSPRTALVAVAAACAALGAAGPARAAGPAEGAPPRADSVLVKVDAGATAAQRADVTRDLAAGSSRGLVGRWRAYRVPSPVTAAQAGRALAGDPAVAGVEVDPPVRPLLTPDDPLFPQQWDMTRIGAPQLWDGPDGAPVVVAVVDTGVDVTHPDLAGAIWTNPGEIAANGLDDDHNGFVDDVHGWDFLHHDATLFDDAAADEHGTHVAGTIAAVRGDAAGVAGIAAAARVMPVKFIQGTGSIADAILALDYARDNGARVVNASFGITSFSQALCDAVADVTASGVLVVAAAGNSAADNDATHPSPAACDAPGDLAVAATTSDDLLASYSNVGLRTVELGAPGSAIVSTLPGGLYGAMSGTSMAAPHVTGAAAAILARHPSLGPVALKTALVEGGEPLPALAGKTQRGTLLSIPGALARVAAPPADTTPPDALSPLAPAAGLATTDTRPVFSWTEAVDHGVGTAGYRVVVDGGQAVETPAEVLSWQPSSPLAEGAHTWRVDAVDAADNVRTGSTRTLAVDTTPPGPFAFTSPATVDTLQPAVAWTAAADATPVTYQVTTTGFTATVAAPQTSWTFPSSMVAPSQAVTVRAVDAAGNSRAVVQVLAYVPPTPPPSIVALSPLSGAVGPRPALRWSPAQPGNWGLAAIRVRVDGMVAADLPPSTTAWTPAADLAPGAHSWSVAAVDQKGRESVEAGPFTLSVPGAAPTKAPAAPAAGAPPPVQSIAPAARTIVVRVRPAAVPRRYVARLVVGGRVVKRITGRLPARTRTLRLRVPSALAARHPAVRVRLTRIP